MFRRVVAALVLAGFLVGQAAAIPHAHGADADGKHRFAPPHLHLPGVDGDHHEHEPRRHATHRDHATASGNHHDDDAIYLQPINVASSGADPSQNTILKSSSLAAQLPARLSDSPLFKVLSFAWRQPRPDSTGGRCALFLTLQTLRI